MPGGGRPLNNLGDKMLDAALAFETGSLGGFMLTAIQDTCARAVCTILDKYNKTLPTGATMAKVYEHPFDEKAFIVGWLDGSSTIVNFSGLTKEETEELLKHVKST